MPPKKSTTDDTDPSGTRGIYFQLYDQYTAKYGPKTVILFQIGSFYELYDIVNLETGKSRTNVYEILTSVIPVGNPSIKTSEDGKIQTYFWGFQTPFISKYEPIFIQNDYTVVIYDQEMDGMGKTQRTLKRISSPGTFVEMEAITQRYQQERNIVGILIDSFLNEQRKPVWHLASTAFEASTGRLVSTENIAAIVDGSPILDTFEGFWSVYPPSEVVVWTHETVTAVISEATVRSWFPGWTGTLHLYPLKKEETTVAAVRGLAEFVHRTFAPKTAISVAEYLGLQHSSHAFECLSRLLAFVADHTPSHLQHLSDHTLWTPENELLLGNSALQQLNMTPIGKPTECLLHWLQRAFTAGGKRFLRSRCLKPVADIDELNRRQDRIAVLRDLSAVQKRELEQHLRGIYDMARISRKLQVGNGTAVDLQQLLQSCHRIQKILEMDSLSAYGARKMFEMPLSEILNRFSLERLLACTSGHGLAVGPHHPWTRGIHAELDAFEDRWSELTGKMQGIKQTWEAIIGEDKDKECLKLEWKDDAPFTFQTTKRRATILVETAKKRRLPVITAKQKGSSGTNFLESAELSAINVEALHVWSEWDTAIRAVWATEWANWKPMFEIMEWVDCLDAEFAFARIADEYGYTRPIYVENTETAGLSVRGLRHPILERVLTATPYIAQNMELGCLVGTNSETQEIPYSKHGILLYGVNAAGKSSLSKAIGLAVLMAQCGLPVPATQMTLAPYTALFTRILGNDNLWAGMSSFVVEMTEFRSILRAAGPKTLVLGDELCAGTETKSAITIVAAGILRLVQKETQFIFATHLHELMDMSEISELQTVRPYHLTVVADGAAAGGGGKLIYDRQLKEGSGCPMYGLEVCRGLDMDPTFLTLAIDLRKRLERTPAFTKASRYNAAVPIQTCHVCGAQDRLETHHIVPQCDANKRGFTDVGRHKNDVGNLVVLCESCHDRHHAGKLVIKGWAATTEGRSLLIA